MSQISITVSSMTQLPDAARQIISLAGEARILVFRGEMGAGKTTLIKELCRQLGSTDNFSSPTFSIVNEYDSPGGKLFHFDLFRLKNAAELLDIGIDEYLNSGSWCFFEWPDLGQDRVQPPYIRIDLSGSVDERNIHASTR